MEKIEPIKVDMSKDKLEFMERRKLEKAAEKKSNINEGIEAIKTYSDKLGILNYESLAKMGLIFAARDENNKIIPLTKDDTEIHDLKTIEYG